MEGDTQYLRFKLKWKYLTQTFSIRFLIEKEKLEVTRPLLVKGRVKWVFPKWGKRIHRKQRLGIAKRDLDNCMVLPQVGCEPTGQLEKHSYHMKLQKKQNYLAQL